MKVRNLIVLILYIVLGVAFSVSLVLAISTAFAAPFALSLERYITIDLAYYEFDLLAFCQNIMLISAVILIVVLVFFDERASKKIKRYR